MSQTNGDSFSDDASFREFEGKRYALVVGVNKPNKVPSLPALRYAESDATGIGYLLSRKECNFAFPSGLLIGEAASTQNVRKAISYLIDGKNANDLLLFYFIGHGYPVKIDEERVEVYPVTSDFDPDQAKYDPRAYLSLDDIRKMLYEYQKEASAICILDCCHAGSMIESPPPEKQLVQSLEALATNVWKAEQLSASSHQTWAILASTEQGATTYEHINDCNEGHALMTGLIINALSGDAQDALDDNGNLTLQTLYAYLQTQMQMLASRGQHPILQATFHNPLILAHDPSKNPVLRSPDDYPQIPSRQSFDTNISPATFADLDLEQVQMFLKKQLVQIQWDYRAGLSEQAQMQALDLLQGEHPSYGALLCFGHNPSHQIAGAYTRCIYWSDTRRLSGWEDDREYRGSLLQQFTQARDFLRNHLRFSRIIDRSGSSEQPEIPFRVLEEALANALIHREYVTEPDHTVRTEGVQVEIFSDRIEIKSPGRPPVPLNTEHPKSHPRNSQIMRIFYLAGYVEKLGTGIKRMQRLMWEAGLKDLDIRSSQQTFTIILFRPVRSLALLAPAEADMQAPQRTSQAQAPRSPLPPTFLLPPSQIRKLVVSQIARGTSQTQVPRPPSSAQSQKVYDNPVTPIPLFSPDQSNPDRNNKQLVRPVPRRIASPRAMPVEPDKNNKLLVRPVLKASPRSRKPLSTTLYILLITAVVLAVMVSAYAVDKQSYLLTAMSRHEPASTTIKIASDFPASGLDTIDGLPLQNGVQMAITEANKELFLPGYTLTLVAYNDVGTGNRPDPQVGANNLKQAIADNLVAGVIGPYNSSVALKELSLANQAPLALLSPSATFPCLTKSAADDPDCTGTHDFAAQMRPTKQLTFFRLAATDDQQGKAAADYFFQTKHYSKVLLLKDDTDAYSFGLAQAFQTEWQRMGGPVIAVDSPQSATSVQNYQDTLQTAASFQPDLIYFAGDDPNGSYVLQALSNIPTLKTVAFAGGDGIMNSGLLEIAASSHRDAPIYASLPIEDPAHSGTATGIDFETNYTSDSYSHYRPYAAAAYDSTMILIQAIKTALQKSISSSCRTHYHAGTLQFRQAVLQVLRAHISYTGATGTHSFDRNGDMTNHTVSFYQANLSTSPLNWTWLQQVSA